MKQEQADKILTSAYNCISKYGYAQVSLRDISDEAGVVLSQLNYYYKNKEGLFREVVRYMADQYIHEIETILLKGAPGKESFHYLIEYLKGLLTENPGLIRLLFDLVSMSIWNSCFRELFNGLFREISMLFQKYLITKECLKANNTLQSEEALAKVMVGTVFGLLLQHMLDSSEPALHESLDCLDALSTQWFDIA